MKRFSKFLLGGLACVSGLIYALCSANKTTLIRNYGIRSTNNWLEALLIIFIVICSSALILNVVIPLIQRFRAKKIAMLQEATINANRQLNEANERKERAILSVDNKLSDQGIYKTFQSVMEPWQDSIIRTKVSTILMQLIDMNTHQEKLQALIEINGATDTLSDTIDVLESTEQGMLLQVRKAINSATIYNPNNSEDITKMNDILTEAEAYNNEQLAKVKDLLDATGNYLNNQSNHKGVEKIDLYTAAIKEHIEIDN